MAIKFNRSQTFATGGTVTSAALHNLVDGTDIYAALITDQANLSTVSTADKLLIADTDDTVNAKSVTVQELFDDALTNGTYTNAQLTGSLSYGTATGNRTVSTSATITTGTINNATLGTTTGTAATFTNATTTGSNITNGTIQTLTSSTANITTGTIGNLSTTLAGDFTISQGTATLGTSGVTAGTYGTSTIIPRITVDNKGRVTTVSTSSVSFTPANASITPSMLSQPMTFGTAVASTSGTAIDFTGIPNWVKRITVIFNGISTNGTSDYAIQIGSGSFTTSGYGSYVGYFVNDTNANTRTVTSGFGIYNGNAAGAEFGQMVILNITGNTWVYSYSGGNVASGAPAVKTAGGSLALSGQLDMLRITTVGTNTFDAGSVNIAYEG